jgi:hypothetical protein
MKYLASEIAWIAGLFEGEGSVGVYYNKRGTAAVRLTIAQKTDEVLVRCYEILNMGHVYGPYRIKGSQLMLWAVSNIEDVYKVIQLIYPWLSQKRQVQCDVVVEYIKTTPKFKRLNKDQT